MKKIQDKIQLSNIKTLVETAGLFKPFERWVEESFSEIQEALLHAEGPEFYRLQGRCIALKELLEDIRAIRDLDELPPS
jgi:hypothetical protein